MALSDLDREDTTIYKVVVNHEEQYSIWPDYKDLPLGWTHEAAKPEKEDGGVRQEPAASASSA
jgi:MbtH protein